MHCSLDLSSADSVFGKGNIGGCELSGAASCGNYYFRAMLLVYFDDRTSTDTSLSLNGGVGVARSKKSKNSRDSSIREGLHD